METTEALYDPIGNVMANPDSYYRYTRFSNPQPQYRTKQPFNLKTPKRGTPQIDESIDMKGL